MRKLFNEYSSSVLDCGMLIKVYKVYQQQHRIRTDGHISHWLSWQHPNRLRVLYCICQAVQNEIKVYHGISTTCCCWLSADRDLTSYMACRLVWHLFLCCYVRSNTTEWSTAKEITKKWGNDWQVSQPITRCIFCSLLIPDKLH